MPIPILLVLAFLAFTPYPALSGDLDELKSQVEDLRQEIKALRDQSNQKGPESTPPPPHEPSSHAAEQMDHDFDLGPDRIDIPKLNVRGFMDVGFNINKSTCPPPTSCPPATPPVKQKTDSFFLGQIDFLVTSKLTEQASVLVEAYVNNPPDNTSPINWPRAFIQYSLSNQLNVRLGAVHTMVGYWNHAYHHGGYLQTSYSRPEIWRFDRTYLPIHSVGAQVFGIQDGHNVDVHYTIGIYNGRGSTGGSQRVSDANDPKAVGLVVSFVPHRFLEDFTVGGSFWGDKIPPNCLPPCTTATTPIPAGSINRTKPMAERILGAHVLYKRESLHVVGEIFHIYHDDDTTLQTYKTLGYYVEAEYAINTLTPYSRFDYINFGNNDPFYSPNVIDVNRYTAGIRWDFMPWNALKVEYSYADNKNTLDGQTLVTNVSFAF